jgi:hypothetical protein
MAYTYLYLLGITYYTSKGRFKERKNLTVVVSEEEYMKVSECAKDSGLSISSFMREKLGIEDASSTALLMDFIDRAAKYPLGKTFPLRNLYTDMEWEKLWNKKAYLGQRFRRLVDAKKLTGLEIKGEDEYRTATYSRNGKVELKADDTLEISEVEKAEVIPRTEMDELHDSFMKSCGNIWDTFVSLCKLSTA